MTERSLKVAVVGCGKIADLHWEAIYFNPRAQLVGVCDRDPLMAYQAGRRWSVPYYSQLSELIEKVQPDVLHITTPPQSHRELALAAVSAGCHLYIEKPLGMSADETKEILARAAEKNLRVVAGYNALFSRAFERARAAIQTGRLGGRPFQIETCYAYPVSLAELPQWVTDLPGGWIQNVVSHVLAPIAEWFEGETFDVTGLVFQSPKLAAERKTSLPDELRLLIRDEAGRAAVVTFSAQLQPPHYLGALYRGANGTIWVDNSSQTVFFDPAISHRSYLNYVLPPRRRAQTWRREAWRNLRDLVRNRNRAQYGMQRLADLLYRSILEGGPSPIPPDTIRREAILLDRVVQLIQAYRAERPT